MTTDEALWCAWSLFWAWLGAHVFAEVSASDDQRVVDAHLELRERFLDPADVEHDRNQGAWHRCAYGGCESHGCRGCAPCPGPLVISPGDKACRACGYAFFDEDDARQRRRDAAFEAYAARRWPGRHPRYIERET